MKRTTTTTTKAPVTTTKALVTTTITKAATITAKCTKDLLSYLLDSVISDGASAVSLPSYHFHYTVQAGASTTRIATRDAYSLSLKLAGHYVLGESSSHK